MVCADLDSEKAALAASKIPGARALSVEAALDDPAVDLVLNLTVPLAHYSVSMRAIEAGKHVYVEKPLATTFEEGRHLLDAAESRGLTVGCAPDTVFGAGIQTCVDLVRDGALGAPIGANAFMLCPGHESWHPSPEFYYERGGGPLFDMGPYYLTALVTLLGPIRAVSGMASTPCAGPSSPARDNRQAKQPSSGNARRPESRAP